MKHSLALPLTLGLLLVMGGRAAQAASQDVLSTMEQQLFVSTFEDDPAEQRLKRIEQYVYGQEMPKKPEKERVTALIPIILPSETSLPALPVAKTAAPKKLAQESDYPTLDQLETKVFGKPDPAMAVEARLDRLEKAVFQKAQSGPLDERTDRLVNTVLGADAGENLANTPSSTPNNDPPAAVTPEIMQALGEAEKKILRQQFPNEPFETRISRLEQKVFNSTAPDMSPEDRLYRVVSVAAAQNQAPVDMSQGGITLAPGFGNPYRPGMPGWGTRGGGFGMSIGPGGMRPFGMMGPGMGMMGGRMDLTTLIMSLLGLF